MNEYEIVIGLEVHVELSTKTKIFCSCPSRFGGTPNTRICPVCTGMPGALPVLNKNVVEYALKVAIATDCEINRSCFMDRKNYYYPDSPRNYQISQLYVPLCHDGFISVDIGKKIRIHEIHMEDDAGKLVHDALDGCTLIDYNRAGVPLIEIVTDPDMRSADEVIGFLEELKTRIDYLGVSDCKLEEGSMRVDVNLSVRRLGEALGTRTEMKNLNSLASIRRAI
ncbi:MAG TPA: Asp-tRNA(Asn)/Glu-tRNA(Gln) amidotransferase subunit GatB, partial [Eubacterium sp.]|nr:Asp-tRNA(Asn)/Glu-tRNA(Gln) amidotransferase subunit GatB [Eubacterium sp.]